MSQRTLDDELSALIANLSPTSQRTLTRAIATELRRRQKKRIGQQRNPDGSAYAPRKHLRDREGNLRGKMFNKLRTAKYMKAQSNQHEAIVTFTNRVMNLANVHQYGLRDRVSLRGKEVKYAQRELLGFDDQVIDWIKTRVIEQLAR
ncbi:phage virion morphogenesis protein [Serratia ureilytica]|uniref:Phage virion morphogenesis protein n=1 Tax=Serratia ureilytica TaxID=300181 RepID=A0A9X9C0C9_9GAMM|nr:phage virion morphogenesis protein [Serratia ureilytica]TXE26929.1 phage virion morphogenesis protein [Serratia ureilytica]